MHDGRMHYLTPLLYDDVESSVTLECETGEEGVCAGVIVGDSSTSARGAKEAFNDSKSFATT